MSDEEIRELRADVDQLLPVLRVLLEKCQEHEKALHTHNQLIKDVVDACLIIAGDEIAIQKWDRLGRRK